MKKRDFYILAILAGIVIYASLHRRSYAEKSADKFDNLLKQNASTEAFSVNDSLRSEPMRVIKAEI
ncbi:hypothetical protein [Mangrovibacterium sp.]|uniref:hypothetical protein n=1 Tax=Mangrovibacterium sp. TaxID=1961364 RepID=UPI003567DC86